MLAFEDTGAYRLLLPAMSEDPAELQRFYEETVAPLVAYDDQYETDLVQTLETFLDADGNVAGTAARLYTHRHTVRYRLERVKDLTGARRRLHRRPREARPRPEGDARARHRRAARARPPRPAPAAGASARGEGPLAPGDRRRSWRAAPASRRAAPSTSTPRLVVRRRRACVVDARPSSVHRARPSRRRAAACAPSAQRRRTSSAWSSHATVVV